MLRFVVPLVLALCVLNLSCKKDESSPAAALFGSIMPLKVGNSWTYKITGYDFLGAVLPFSFGDISLRITNETTIGSEKWYSLDGSLVTNRADGLWSRDSLGREQLDLKYPANVNDTYTSGSSQIVVTSTNQSIGVPQGQYSCYAYRYGSGTSFEVVQFCAPNVGIVKIEGYQRTLSGRTYVATTFELKGLTLN